MLTREQIEELRFVFMEEVGRSIAPALYCQINSLCDMALALSAARRDAELLDGIEKHKLTIYHTWRDKTESGWTDGLASSVCRQV